MLTHGDADDPTASSSPSSAAPLHPTPTQRAELGRHARSRASRGTLGDWTPRPGRPDPVATVRGQEVDRVQELLPIRRSRMAESPFAFYRGAAAVMADDLGAVGGPANSGIIVQLCGDAHLSNFGLFASPDRSLVFDINDFDETHIGPFEWDVARLAASFWIAAEQAGIRTKDVPTITRRAVETYRVSMGEFANMNELDVWYSRIDADSLTTWANSSGDQAHARAVARVLKSATERDRWSAVRSLTERTLDGPVFANRPPLLVRLPNTGSWDTMVTDTYRAFLSTLLPDRAMLLSRYLPIDFGHKVVGVGSVGLRALVLLLQGRDENDLLVLQAKQAVHSVLAPFTPTEGLTHMGERVVRGQRLMQAATDPLLGWATGPAGTHYYVRQIRDMKWSPDIAKLSFANFLSYAAICGQALARAHARAGDAIAISAYLGTSSRFDKALVEFAHAYSVQTTADHAAFAAYARSCGDGGTLDARAESTAIERSLQHAFDGGRFVTGSAGGIPATLSPTQTAALVEPVDVREANAASEGNEET